MGRALVLNHNFREQGTWFRARRIARGLHERGMDVLFIYTGRGWYRPRRVERAPGWEAWETASWTLFPSAGHGYYPLGLAQRLSIARGRFDLVYTFSHFSVDQGVPRLLGPSRCRFWMTDWCDFWNSERGGLHDTRHWQRPLPAFLSGLRGLVLRTAFRLEDTMEVRAACDARAVSIIARPMRRQTRRLGIPDSRVLHLPSGADMETIRPLPPGECRRKLGLPRDAVVAAYVASTTLDNRQLAAAMHKVWERNPHLVLVSAGPSWEAGDPALRRARREGRFLDLGQLPFPRIPEVLGAASLLVMPLSALPFNQCRWPNKFGDYLASGRPVATTRVGDMGRIVQRHHTGTVGEPDADGLAGAILRLAEDPELRRECGWNARTYAEAHLRWDDQLDKLARFLHRRRVPVEAASQPSA